MTEKSTKSGYLCAKSYFRRRKVWQNQKKIVSLQRTFRHSKTKADNNINGRIAQNYKNGQASVSSVQWTMQRCPLVSPGQTRFCVLRVFRGR